MPQPRFAFGPYVYETSTATLWRDAALVPIGGRGAAVLQALLEADSGVVTKSALMERTWPRLAIEENNLAVQVATLRKILGTRPDGEEWIGTVQRIGYRLVRDGKAAAAERPAIAVMPFTNMSSDPEQDYFADGMVEDLITALSRFKTFAVVARNSSFVYKGRAVDVRQVSRELGVRYVLEGSVRRTGKRVRISAQLIDGQSGADLWAENIDGTIEDVLDFQDRVTERVVGLIEPRIREVEIERARRKRPDSLNAYDLYLQALPRYHRGAMRVEDYDELIDLLQRAIALDPTFAPALALCAWHHEKRFTRNGTAPAGIDDAAEAIRLAEEAMAADSSDAFVLLVAGVVRLTIVGDEVAGFDLIMRALAVNPNNFLIRNTAGYAQLHRGNYDEAIACNMRALELSPSSPDAFWSFDGLARAFLAAGRFEEALVWGLRGREATTALDFSYCVVAAAYAHLGRLDDAREAVVAVRAVWPALTITRLVGHYGQPREYDRLLAEGLRRAGLPEAEIS